MANFIKPWEKNTLDYLIMLNGSISLYYKQDALAHDKDSLIKLKYSIVNVDPIKLNSFGGIYNLIYKAIGLGYNSSSLDSFFDYMSDSSEIDLLKNGSEGLVVSIDNCDTLYNMDSKIFSHFLYVLSEVSRVWMLEGYKIIFLIRFDEKSIQPEIEFSKKIPLNGKEFFNN
jgi:hypothetical protein